jgi:hypothetical protein
VVCQLCGVRLWRITAQHLWAHDPALTFREYKRMFPDAATCCETLRGFHSEQRRIDNPLPGFIPWSRRRILAQFRREMKRQGRQPTVRAWPRRSDLPSLTTIYKLFGTWNALVLAAGGTPRPPVGFSAPQGHRRKRCAKGHPIIERNGHRVCWECKRESARVYAAIRRRAEGTPTKAERNLAQRTGEWRECPICGRTFYVKLSVARSGRGGRGCTPSHAQQAYQRGLIAQTTTRQGALMDP